MYKSTKLYYQNTYWVVARGGVRSWGTSRRGAGRASRRRTNTTAPPANRRTTPAPGDLSLRWLSLHGLGMVPVQEC